MRITLSDPNSSSGTNWLIIELQGELEFNSEICDSLYVGKFNYIKDKDQATFTIGDHMLVGKLVKLKNPFGIFKKVHNGGETKYELAGVVKEKYLFQQRPKQLIENL